jgi:D-xylose transport system ATP-binding protein
LTTAPLLRTEGIVKRFGGVVALDRVSFDLRPGEIHALCGENGAGKSTLIKIISGLHPAGSYQGSLLVDEGAAAFGSIRDAERAGIAVIYQELALVGELSVAENVFLGSEPRSRYGLIDRDRMLVETRELLGRFGIELDPEARVSTLGVGHQQLVEVVRALRKRSRILVLDEPTAALTDKEANILLSIVRDLPAQGIGCIYISHRLDEVFAIADRITVLRDGRTVATRPRSETSRDEVIRHMVGREVRDLFPRRAARTGPVLLRLAGLDVAPRRGAPARLVQVSLEARAGEVLGLGGLMGAGRTELMMHLVGAWGHRVGGQVELLGAPLAAGIDPRRALGLGLALVSEDRKRYGLVLDKTVGFNLSLSSLGRVSRRLVIDGEAEHLQNRAMFESLRIKAPSLDVPAGQLSGGNQQKVVLGKVLATEPKVVLLDEPTRGIDIGAKLEVYELINQLTERGLAVVLASSELPELIGMSDRIVMLRDGAIGGTFERAETTPEKLLAAAMATREVA